MAAIETTAQLLADLAKVIGMKELVLDANKGCHLTIGDDNDAYLYDIGDARVLVVVPVAKLPLKPDYALVSYLFRSNLFDSEFTPFQIATDDDGMILQWARLNVADYDGTILAKAIDNLAARATKLRGEIEPKAG